MTMKFSTIKEGSNCIYGLMMTYYTLCHVDASMALSSWYGWPGVFSSHNLMFGHR